MTETKKCGCGLTKDQSGNCDGSHTTKNKNAANPKKEIPYKNITIRCIALKGEPQKVKFMYPSVANNKQLMRTVGFTISDPNYEKKMAAFKAQKPYIENGVVVAPVEKPKRTRRTKAEIAKSKQTSTESQPA